MANASDYLENKLIDHIFRATSFTAPSTLYIAACTVTPSDSDTGSTITEPSGGSYARVQYDPSSSSHWEATQGGVSGASSGTGGTTSNHDTLTWPTATGSWGTITAVAICDASSAGNMLYWGALSSSKTIGSGDVLQVTANNLSVAIDS